MNVEIFARDNNPLLKRIEISFKVEHESKEGTPPRVMVRKNLAAILKKDLDLIYIKKMETKTGTSTTVGEANIYDSTDQAHLIEREHILTRNVPTENLDQEEGKLND